MDNPLIAAANSPCAAAALRRVEQLRKCRQDHSRNTDLRTQRILFAVDGQRVSSLCAVLVTDAMGTPQRTASCVRQITKRAAQRSKAIPTQRSGCDSGAHRDEAVEPSGRMDRRSRRQKQPAGPFYTLRSLVRSLTTTASIPSLTHWLHARPLSPPALTPCYS